jgi:hypothetical protein
VEPALLRALPHLLLRSDDATVLQYVCAAMDAALRQDADVAKFLPHAKRFGVPQRFVESS